MESGRPIFQCVKLKKKNKIQIKSTDYYVFVVSLTAKKKKYEFMIDATYESILLLLLLITNGKPL